VKVKIFKKIIKRTAISLFFVQGYKFTCWFPPCHRGYIQVCSVQCVIWNYLDILFCHITVVSWKVKPHDP